MQFDFDLCFILVCISKPVQGNSLFVVTKVTGLFNKSLPEAKATANLLKLQMVSFAAHSLQTKCVALLICVNMSILVVGYNPLTFFVTEVESGPKIKQATKCDAGSPCFY